MLNVLARYQKPIAWLFAGIFYVELIATPILVRAADNDTYRLPGSNFRNTNASVNNMGFSGLPAEAAAYAPVKTVAKENRKRSSGFSPGLPRKKFTTGPTQPEMQSFQSVNASNMVDLFTGDFSYNIPLLDVGGYPVNLHYSSGITMDQEASWVGLGWNINPGTITRNMRGLPDDFNGDADMVKKTLSIKPNKTIGVTGAGNAELFGASQLSALVGKDGKPMTGKGDSVKGRPGTLGISLGVFHNTYKGWGTEFGVNASINAGIGAKGSLTGNLGITNNSQGGLDVSPSLGFHLGKNQQKTTGNVSIGTNYNSRIGIQNLQITGEVRQHLFTYKSQNYTSGTGISSYISFSRPSYTPTISIPYTSYQYSFTVKLGSEHWAFHPNFSVRGYGSTQKIEGADTSTTLPAYGYLYYEKANGNQNVLLDFNREKDVSYTEGAPHIAIPIYTYDTYSITGEGTGGMFRPYRGDIGYVFDHSMSTKSNSDRFSIDVGLGTVVHGGIDYNRSFTNTDNSPWMGDNAMKDVIGFRNGDTTFENVYFKNPGEKTSVNKGFLDAIGDDNLVRVDLNPLEEQNHSIVTATRNLSLFRNGQSFDKRTLSANTLRVARDKRTQVISYLTAAEASAAGLDKMIRNYGINSFPAVSCSNSYTPVARFDNRIRLQHHLSQITVLNPDGRRYIYGIPVYNISQTEVTMSTGMGDNNTGLVKYTPGIDNTTRNSRGKEGYFNKEQMPAYAHSFLLSGILSDNYVDVTGDGITDDDNGEAVKFNYSRIYGNGISDTYKWRAPFEDTTAAYNDGLKTDSRDERGSYTYGEREVWYMNSIESKTMIATFLLETGATRKDGFSAKGEDGGIDNSKGLYRLKEINLYTKADFLKNGQSQAKPIKTVHFEYSYELCKKNPGSLTDSGKLTLKKVWFTYNKNNKGQRNPYVFTYHPKNPDYSSKYTDRWGNYKDPAKNPSTGKPYSNADYPYTLQEKTGWNSDSAAAYAAPWTLSEIGLPSGGKIKVSYESDDYAYVQDKRAMQFFTLAGFDSISTGTAPNNNLYRPYYTNKDYLYAFVNVTEPVADKAEIQRKYLEGVNQLFFKMAVNVPGDRWGKGYEIIPTYADIEDYGVKTGSSNMTIWIKLKPIANNKSPLATAAIQFLRLNLGSKAYPYSEPGENFDLKSFLGTMASIATNLTSAIDGFDNDARDRNKCNSLVLEKSFVRLNNPLYKKYGGGLRVKRVEVRDNWSTMTGGQQQEAVYGQDYDYTTTQDINGVPTTISSGVATYEPAVGGDENPFRVPHKVYTQKVGALAPVDYMYTEEPFAETFFPAPMIGYSKVKVQTMHKTRKSANGFDETEFYTCRDFPTLVEFTPLDDESKKTYSSPLANVFKFDAKQYVTLSQGFKVELNDMNGKMKSQASYSQTDLKNPISYTQNYFRLENDNSLKKKLSNNVAVVDSSNGRIDYNGEIGKEVELMIDVREQATTTVSASVEVNVDFAHPFPFIIFPSFIPLPSKETNRYRAIAVTKVVNRYGLLDSVLHIEKGSRVTTRNMIYDGETGDVLVSQTNNEFDDPVYNFNYPAHWAYSGMGQAYKNTSALFSNWLVKQGKVYNRITNDTFPMHRFFESGDELLLYANSFRWSFTNDTCSSNFFRFLPAPLYTKVWAINAAKAQEGHRGIYLIDASGKPYSGEVFTAKVIRSGRRNLSSTPVGSITSLKNPIRVVNNIPRLVLDTATDILASGAARFKDVWQVDSTLYRKDTVMQLKVLAALDSLEFPVIDAYSIRYGGYNGKRGFSTINTPGYFLASTFDDGRYDEEVRTWLKFDFSQLRGGMLLYDAHLKLPAPGLDTPQLNQRYSASSYPLASNQSYIERVKGLWVRDAVNAANFLMRTKIMSNYYNQSGQTAADAATKVVMQETPRNVTSYRPDEVEVTQMVTNMIADYRTSAHLIAPSVMIRLAYGSGLRDNSRSQMSYNTGFKAGTLCGVSTQANAKSIFNTCAKPTIKIRYYKPCNGGVNPTYSATPTPGYYCLSEPIDTFICRPNIDTIFNPYVWGVWGNWRMDRAYTYYDRREQSDPSVATNIRTDGEIKDFRPFWAFTNNFLQADIDTNRWVWNSEISMVNSKGYEIENHDPLNRYNSGQYGYNRTLPVAVTQNSKNRNAAFEGFEDYDYKTDTCTKCPVPRFIDLSSGGNRVDTTSHTGKYSIRIAGNQTGSTLIPVVTYARDTITPKVSMRIDSTPLITTKVTPKGNGLVAQFLKTSNPIFFNPCPSIPVNVWQNMPYNTNIGYTSAIGYPQALCNVTQFKMRWYGYLQPAYTETYRFYIMADDYIRLTINGRTITSGTPVEGPHHWDQYYPIDTMTLQAGQLYFITAEYTQLKGVATYFLDWESASQSREVIPLNRFYVSETDAAGSVKNDTVWCVKPQALKPTRVTLNNFSPLQGTKVVVSAWVKEDGICVSGTYANNSLELQFNNGSPSNFVLKPKGPVIEGWQRIEDTLTIPVTATNVTVKLRSLSSTAVFFDDVRIHPFNANMKSFIYNPVNIRLMAELDENNYATFYEYDDEGTLIRVKKETERGIKTIKETRSALLKN